MRNVLIGLQLVSLTVNKIRSTDIQKEFVVHLYIVCLFVFVCLFVCLFVCFLALRPKSTAMVMAGGSVHLTTLFPRQV